MATWKARATITDRSNSLAYKGFSARQQTMEFGIQFFPAVGPALKSPSRYWGEALPAHPPCRPARLRSRPHCGTLLPLIRRLQSRPADFPQRCCGRHAQNALDHRSRPASLQQSLKACRPNRHGCAGLAASSQKHINAPTGFSKATTRQSIVKSLRVGSLKFTK